MSLPRLVSSTSAAGRKALEGMKFGFELEMVWPRSYGGYPELFKAVRASLKASDCADFLQGVRIVADASIDDGVGEARGLEIVTPPWPAEEAASRLAKLLAWMADSKAKTNKSTGLHINVGFKDKAAGAQVDMVELLDKVPQDEILARFGRSRNQYCESTRKVEVPFEQFAKKVFGVASGDDYIRAEKLREALSDPELLSRMDQAFRALMQTELKAGEKSLAIVRKKGRGAGAEHWFEFRMTGNKGYESRFKEFDALMVSYAKALKASRVRDPAEPKAKRRRSAPA